MSLDIIIQAAKSKGRGNDTMLVHMTPAEVQTLQGIAQAHGGSLTTNPDTGLPEAGFLEGILPAVAGIGLSAVGLSPIAAGLVAGGATGLITGSMEKGLMAGLGAFGGAGLGSSLAGAGAASANAANLAATSGAGISTAVPTLSGVSAAPGMTMGTLGSAGSIASPTVASGLGAAVPQTLGTATNFAPSFSAPVQQPGLMQSMGNQFSNMGQGLQQLMTNPSDTVEQMGGWGSLAKHAGLAAAPMLYQGMQQPEQEQELDPGRGYIETYDFNQTRRANRQPGERFFDTSYTRTGRYRPEDFPGYAEGGDVGSGNPFYDVFARDVLGHGGGSGGAAPVRSDERVVFEQERLATPDAAGRQFRQEFKSAPLTQADRERGLVAAVSEGATPDEQGGWRGNPRQVRMMRRIFGGFPQGSRIVGGRYDGMEVGRGAGLGGYEGYAQGGMPRHLKGPGDGQSDSIPAMVDGVQPAGLSTDEFVVPADVVSQLGNGSSDAGAKQLYAMMDRIREKAHGTKRQQRPVDPSKVLPA